MRAAIASAALLLLPLAADAAIKSRVIEYRDGDAVLEGFLAWDDETAGARPGVLVIHDWVGVSPYVQSRCEQLARLGYVAFAADVYGKGVRPQTPAEAARQAGRFKGDRPLLRSRVNAGLAALRELPTVDRRRVAAIGYCFGGTAALELARSGADVAGVVSFHGGLDSPTPEDAKKIRAKVLVLHGGDDPHVPPAEVAAFEAEMRAAGVDWQLVAYGGAVHSFTRPDAGSDASKGAAYDERADRRSWAAMRAFFAEIFG